MNCVNHLCISNRSIYSPSFSNIVCAIVPFVTQTTTLSSPWQDLIVTIGTVFFFLIACIAWSAGNRQLGKYVEDDLLTARAQDCLKCLNSNITTLSTPSHAQVSISLVSCDLYYCSECTFLVT